MEKSNTVNKAVGATKKPIVSTPSESVEVVVDPQEALESIIAALNHQLQNEREEKRYLSQALTAKEHDMVALQKELDKMCEEKMEALKTSNELSNSVKIKDEQIHKLSEVATALQAAEQRRVGELNEVLTAYEALHKNMQGALEVSSLLKDKLVSDVSKA